MTTHLIAKTASSVELTFRGIQLIHSSTPHSENRKRAWDMIYKAPCEVMEYLLFPFVLIYFGVSIIKEPKYYILQSSEMSKVALRHAEAGTIDSEDHKNDLYDANSIIKDRLMEWQKKNRGLRTSQTSLNQ